MIIRNQIEEVKKFGIKNAFFGLIYKFINKIVFLKVLQGMVLTINSLNLEMLVVPSGYDVTLLSKDELLKYSKDKKSELEKSFIDAALEKGDQCLGFINNDILASYGWYSNSATSINEDLSLIFDNYWTYNYKGYTNPSHRGKRLHAIGMAIMLTMIAKKNFCGILAYVEIFNFRSLRSTKRLGFRPFGKVYVLKIFDRYWIKAEKSCSPYGFNVKSIKGFQK